MFFLLWLTLTYINFSIFLLSIYLFRLCFDIMITTFEEVKNTFRETQREIVNIITMTLLAHSRLWNLISHNLKKIALITQSTTHEALMTRILTHR